MQLHELSANEALSSLLKTFHSCGGVVHYVQVDVSSIEPTVDPYILHRSSAIFTAQTVTERSMQERQKYYWEHKAAYEKVMPRITSETLYRVDLRKGTKIRPEEARGKQISQDQFFAPPFLYILPEEIEKAPLWLNIQGTLESMHKSDLEGSYFATGSYPYVFHEPPYDLHYEGPDENGEITLRRLTEEEKNTLFQDINVQLFGDKINSLVVYQWTTVTPH